MREKIDLRDLLGGDFEKFHPQERLKGFRHAKSYTEQSDLEKGYSNEVVIFEREDGKFFKCRYQSWTTTSDEIDPIMEEVFPRDITTTVYE